MNNFVYNFEEMRGVDIRTVDISTLKDIRDINIDPNLPFAEKAEAFIRQIKNPYCFRCADVAVKVNYVKPTTTIDDCMEDFYRSL